MFVYRYPLTVLAVFIFFAFFLPLPFVPLFDLDEGAFSEATREMLAGKDYITTYLNGELRFDKPILIYWLQLLSVKLFGINEFAFRLPSALAGSFWALTIYFFVSRVADKHTAFFASLFMIASLQINLIAKAAIADALLNLFIALSMFGIYLYDKEKKKAYLYWVFAFIGLGALTKGPVAIMIPLVVSFLFYLSKKQLMDWVKMVFDPVGILLFSVIVLPWYIAEYLAQGQAFIDGFFLKHNVSRFSNAMESHGGTLFYFIPVLIVGMMPFTYLALKALADMKQYFSDDLKRFLLIWFVFVFVFFSLSGTKLPHYVIYGYTPLFILAAFYVSKDISRSWLIYPVVILLVFLLFLPDIATLFKESIRDALAKVLIDNAYETFDSWYRLYIIATLIFLLVLLLRVKQKELIVVGLAAAMIVSVNYIIIPTYGKLMQLPIKEAGLLAKSRGYKNIVMYGVNTPTFNVYYEGLVSKRKPIKGEIVFTKITKLKDFKVYETLYRKNGFALITVGDD